MRSVNRAGRLPRPSSGWRAQSCTGTSATSCHAEASLRCKRPSQPQQPSSLTRGLAPLGQANAPKAALAWSREARQHHLFEQQGSAAWQPVQQHRCIGGPAAKGKLAITAVRHGVHRPCSSALPPAPCPSSPSTVDSSSSPKSMVAQPAGSRRTSVSPAALSLSCSEPLPVPCPLPSPLGPLLAVAREPMALSRRLEASPGGGGALLSEPQALPPGGELPPAEPASTSLSQPALPAAEASPATDAALAVTLRWRRRRSTYAASTATRAARGGEERCK